MSEHLYCVTITFKITERVQQGICIKFCIKLKLSSGETVQMIQKDFGDDTMSTAQIKVWYSASKMVENLLKLIHILEGLHQAEHRRMLNIYRLQSTKIDDGQCKN